MTNPLILNAMTKQRPPSRAKYLEKQSTEQDEITQKLIPVYESLHAKMRQAADRQGITMYEAYAQASRAYLAKSGFEIPGIGTLTPDEKTLCEEVLHIKRNAAKNKVLEETITLIKSLVRFATKTRG